MQTHIVLLRGINVGGRNLVAMADLRLLLSDLGFHAVRTVLQSGNVIFQSDGPGGEELGRLLGAEVEARFGKRLEFFVRTLKEWEDLISLNPFPQEAASDPGHLIAVFMRHTPDPQAIEQMQSEIKGPERVLVAGEQLYVVYPDGIGTSTIGKTPGWNKLVAQGTARNWNTILKIAELARFQA